MQADKSKSIVENINVMFPEVTPKVESNHIKFSAPTLDADGLDSLAGLYSTHHHVKDVNVKRSGTGLTVIIDTFK